MGANQNPNNAINVIAWALNLEGRANGLLPTGSEEMEVLGVGSIPVAIIYFGASSRNRVALSYATSNPL